MGTPGHLVENLNLHPIGPGESGQQGPSAGGGPFFPPRRGASHSWLPRGSAPEDLSRSFAFAPNPAESHGLGNRCEVHGVLCTTRQVSDGQNDEYDVICALFQMI